MLKGVISVLVIMGTTAAAVVYCHTTFAPKTIVEEIKSTRAVVCVIAIEIMKKEEAQKYCNDLIY